MSELEINLNRKQQEGADTKRTYMVHTKSISHRFSVTERASSCKTINANHAIKHKSLSMLLL